MEHTITLDGTFAKWLRDQLTERGWGIRTLARKMDAENPEVPRRALNRAMRGTRLTEKYLAAIAEALDVDRADLPVKEARSAEPFLPGATGDVGAVDAARRHGGGRARTRRVGPEVKAA